jgi:hypothetical protein
MKVPGKTVHGMTAAGVSALITSPLAGEPTAILLFVEVS